VLRQKGHYFTDNFLALCFRDGANHSFDKALFESEKLGRVDVEECSSEPFWKSFASSAIA
jgi:hypothetical protein